MQKSDVTQRKKPGEKIKTLNKALEIKLKERTLELEAVNKELESFAHSVSHDLRAPLRAINGYAKMLEEKCNGVLDDEARRLLSMIQDNGKRMNTLIDDLLDYSLLGRKELAKTYLDMTALAKSALNDINKTVTHHARVMVYQLHPITADRSLIMQVLVNLLSNAIKYSSKKTHLILR